MTLLIRSLCVRSILLAIHFTLARAARFDITNKCPYTVWPAALPTAGPRQLNLGQTWSIDVPAGTTSGRIWGRTNCNFDGSGLVNCGGPESDIQLVRFELSGGNLQCQISGASPVTLAEFSLNQPNNLDFYDILVIDGFNIPMAFSPTYNGCTSLRCTADGVLMPTFSPKTILKLVVVHQELTIALSFALEL